MRVSRIAIYALLLLVLVAGIGGWQYRQKYIYRQLEKIEELLQHQADSAWQILTKMEHTDRLYGRNRALYSLLYTQACYKNYIPVEGDSLIRFAVEYYSDTADSLRKSKSCFYMAQVCRDRYDRHRALDYFQKAGSAAKGCSEYKFLSLLYYHWGCLLQDEKPYTLALNKMELSCQYAVQNRDTVMIISVLGEMGWGCLSNGDYQLASEKLEKAISYAENIGGKQLGWLNHCYSVLCWKIHKYEKALELADRSLAFWKDSVFRKTVFALKGDIYLDLQQVDSARLYIEKGRNDADFRKKAAYALSMCELEKRLGHYEDALRFHELYACSVDSLMKKEETNRLGELQQKYDYSLMQNENGRLKAKEQRMKILVLVVALVAIALLFVFYGIYNRYKQKKEYELQRNKQEILEKEAVWKERFFHMNEVIRHIENICELPALQKDKKANQIRLSAMEIEQLLSAVNACYNQFACRLQKDYPTLSQIDVCICCLLKVGIRNQDICYLLGIMDEAFKKRKYRIKHDKLKLDIALDDFLKAY